MVVELWVLRLSDGTLRELPYATYIKQLSGGVWVLLVVALLGQAAGNVACRRSETLVIGVDQRVDTAGGASAWIGGLAVVKATK